MDSSTANLISILRERVAALRETGNAGEALHAATAAVEKAQSSLSPDPGSILAFCQTLEDRADIQREAGRYEAACDDYRQALDQLDGMAGREAQAGRLLAGLGAAYDAMDEPASAERHWLASIKAFSAVQPPCLLDVAALSNNLGFIAKAANRFEDAETHFLKSLEILHAELGSEHEETAAVCNNLGALYQSAGYAEQAREMHMMALETRRRLFGESHPDTAQSHNNLALALLATGDRSWARRHLERALAGFEAMGAPCRDDLEAVADNYRSFLREDGESAMADVIARRVAEHLARLPA